ncbi:hypothetical protein BANRA_02154 [Escherichia coli]|nr:hypothetical protein BANRA_02154 [Escherichia coli]
MNRKVEINPSPKWLQNNIDSFPNIEFISSLVASFQLLFVYRIHTRELFFKHLLKYSCPSLLLATCNLSFVIR